MPESEHVERRRRGTDLLLAQVLRAAPPRVLLVLLATGLISIVIFAVSELAARNVASTRADVLHARNAQTQLALLRAGLLQAEASQRGYLLTEDPIYLEPLDDAVRLVQTSLADLIALASNYLEWRARTETLRGFIDQRLDLIKRGIFMLQQGERERALAGMRSGEGVELTRGIDKRLDNLETVLRIDIEHREGRLDDALLQQRIGVGIVVLVNLVFLVVLADRMIRQFKLREEHRADLQGQADLLERTVADRTDELSSLSSHLQASSEREKARLARDLHDELGGILTSAKIDIAWLEGHSKLGDPDALSHLARLSSVLDEAVDLKRRVVENLRPSLLDHLGLGVAVNWYANETCKKADLACRLTSLPDTELVPPEMSIAIYRLVQEGLTNVIKYAQATEVEITLERTSSGYRLVLADNGIGIKGFRPANLSHGLAGMRQRARALGGSFEIRTAPGQGTRIEALFPLAPAAPKAAEVSA